MQCCFHPLDGVKALHSAQPVENRFLLLQIRKIAPKSRFIPIMFMFNAMPCFISISLARTGIICLKRETIFTLCGNTARQINGIVKWGL